MSSKQIFLLSGPRGDGKTTSLKQFVSEERKKGKKVAGILQIVQNDRRYLQFLSTNTIELLQLNDVGAHPKHSHTNKNGDCCNDDEALKSITEESVSVGPFLFSKAVLDNSHKEIQNAKNYDWIIIDEIGPLEIRKKQGYEPAVSQILNLRKSEAFKNTKFVIVVRPSLKEQIGPNYELADNEIADFEDINRSSNLMKSIVIATVITGFCYVLYQRSRN